MQEGRLPLWNPYIFCGLPLAANTQTALYFPFSFLFFTVKTLAAFDVSYVLYLLLAFLGAQLLARRWGVSPGGSFTLAAAFALHPFLLYRIPQGIPTHLAALAFIPWVWLAVEHRSVLFLTLVISLQALSGHPQFTVISLLGLALYLALRRPKALLLLGAALAASAALTAVQWLPTAEFASLSVRAADWNPMYASAYSLHPSYWIGLVWPRALGTPLDPQFAGFPSEFFEMAGLYGGFVPLALSAYGVYTGKRRLAVLALLAAGAALALGAYNPVLKPLFERPGLGSFRVPARWSLLVVWALWLAACRGWKDLHAAPGARPLLAALVVLDLMAWNAPFLYTEDPAKYLAPSPSAARLREGGQRYATAPDVPNANKGMLYRIPNVTGYEAYYLAGAATYASRVQGQAAADGSHTYITKPEAFDKVGLRWFIDGTGIRELKGAKPLSYREGDRLIVAEAFYPGWRAWADGVEVPVEKHDGFLQSVRAPGEIRLRFDPALWTFARWLSLIALLVSLTWIQRFSIPRAS